MHLVKSPPASPAISAMHPPRARSLLAGSSSESSLQLQEGTTDLVTDGGPPLLVMDRGDGGVVVVMGGSGMMSALSAKETASATGRGSHGSGGGVMSATRAAEETSATAGSGSSDYRSGVVTATEHFDGLGLVLWLVLVKVGSVWFAVDVQIELLRMLVCLFCFCVDADDSQEIKTCVSRSDQAKYIHHLIGPSLSLPRHSFLSM